MKQELKFICVTRNLDFVGLKKEDKDLLYKEYPIIIRKPKGVSNIEDYVNFCEMCKNMSKRERQIVYNGILIELSIKEYVIVCTLLLYGDITEKEFNKIKFRPNRCNSLLEYAPRNLEKSIDDIANAFYRKINMKLLEKSMPTLDKAEFLRNFKNNFAQMNTNSTNCSVRNYYKQASLPSFLKRVCKYKEDTKKDVANFVEFNPPDAPISKEFI